MPKRNFPSVPKTTVAGDTVIYDEDPERFEALLDSFLEEHKPLTPTEQFLAEQLAIANWKSRRISRVEVGLIDRQTTEAVRYLPANRDQDKSSELTQEQIDQENTLLLGISFDRDCTTGNSRIKLMSSDCLAERNFLRCLKHLERLKLRRAPQPPKRSS